MVDVADKVGTSNDWDGIGEFDSTAAALRWRIRREAWWRSLVQTSVLGAVFGFLYKNHTEGLEKAHAAAAASQSRADAVITETERGRQFAESERNRAILQLAPLLGNAPVSPATCSLVRATWAAIPEAVQTDMPEVLAGACPQGAIASPAPVGAPFAVQISTDKSLESGCHEARLAMDHGYAGVAEWHDPQGRYVTTLGGGSSYLDAAGTAAGVRAKFNRSVLVVNLARMTSPVVGWEFATCPYVSQTTGSP